MQTADIKNPSENVHDPLKLMRGEIVIKAAAQRQQTESLN